jgi:RimJ/RimL family protein N-acetyltransferase
VNVSCFARRANGTSTSTSSCVTDRRSSPARAGNRARGRRLNASYAGGSTGGRSAASEPGPCSTGKAISVWGEWSSTPFPDEIEVGVVVHPTHWNRGIGTEAVEIVAADCFTRVGLNRLLALPTIDNKSSLRTLEKLGMRRRGVTQHEGDHTTYELFELARLLGSRRSRYYRFVFIPDCLSSGSTFAQASGLAQGRDHMSLLPIGR